MILAREIFIQRNQEITSHLDLIKEYNSTILTKPTITADQFRIVKSFTFVMIYNLIEAVVVSSLESLGDHISSLNIKLADLTEVYQKEWIKTSYHQQDPNDNISKCLNMFKDLHNQVVVNTKLNVNISKGGGGNWKLPDIKNLLKRLGIKHYSIDQSVISNINKKIHNDKGCLEYVVDLRNDLAHGKLSFVECGDYKTIDEIETMYNSIKKYLSSLVECFEKFIEQEGYKESTTNQNTY